MKNLLIQLKSSVEPTWQVLAKLKIGSRFDNDIIGNFESSYEGKVKLKAHQHGVSSGFSNNGGTHLQQTLLEHLHLWRRISFL